MNAYPSQPNAVANPPPNQSPADPFRQSSATNSYVFGSPQSNANIQPNYNNLSINTANANVGRSPAGNGFPTRDSGAQSLIDRMDNILKQNQSPVVTFSSPERKDIPTFNQSNFQNQGIYTSPAYSYPLNSARSQTIADVSPIGLRQSIANNSRSTSDKSDTLPSYKQADKNSHLFAIQEGPKASYLSNSEPRYLEKNPYTAPSNDMGDLKSRLSNLENQLNALDNKKVAPYPDPRSSSINNNAYYPSVTQDAQPSYGQQNYSQYPTTERYGPQSIQPNPAYVEGSYSQYPTNDRHGVSVETNPKRDAEVSGQIVKKIDDLMNAHIFENRSPVRSAALTQRNRYASPTRDTFANPMYKSSVTPTTKSTRDLTPPTYLSTYTSRPGYDSYTPYEPYSTYDSRPNYHSSTNYEPKYGADKTSYESISKYDDTHNKYEPYNSYTSSYEPHYDYERETTSKPYSDSYSSYRPLPRNYDSSAPRQKYIRPLYRNTPEKYRPASSYTSDYYTHDHYPYHASVNSTPSKEYPDTTATDKKLKKLTLKSKTSDDRDNEPVKLAPLPIKTPIHHHGTKRLKFKGSDLLSDNEEDFIPLPQMEDANKQRRVNSRPPVNDKNDKVQKFHSGDLMMDDNTFQYQSDEEPVVEHKKKNASVPPQYVRGLKLATAADYNSGNLLSDTNHNAGDLIDDEEAVPKTNVSHRKGAGASNVPRKSDMHVHHHHAGALLNDGVPVKTRNIADDGKAWNLPHGVSNSIFEETDGSMFDFEENDRKQSTRLSKEKNTKESLNQYNTSQRKSKGVIWSVEDPAYENNHRKDSMRRSDKKPVLAESFEKYGRLGY